MTEPIVKCLLCEKNGSSLWEMIWHLSTDHTQQERDQALKELSERNE